MFTAWKKAIGKYKSGLSKLYETINGRFESYNTIIFPSSSDVLIRIFNFSIKVNLKYLIPQFLKRLTVGIF